MAQAHPGVQEERMKKSDRQLIRLFYQSIPTPNEKEAFRAVMDADKTQRMAYIAAMLGKTQALDEATVQAILAASTLTKEDRVMIFAGALRQWLFSFLGL